MVGRQALNIYESVESHNFISNCLSCNLNQGASYYSGSLRSDRSTSAEPSLTVLLTHKYTTKNRSKKGT